MAENKNIFQSLTERMRPHLQRWWGGIGCRVSFYMMVALLLVASLVGAFFFWEGKQALDAEIRRSALSIGAELAALTMDDIITGDIVELSKKLSPSFAANDDVVTGRSLLYLAVYDHRCRLLIGSTPSEVFFQDRTSFATRGAARDGTLLRDTLSDCVAVESSGPHFTVHQNGTYDLVMPVLAGGERVGHIRVGLSSQRYEERFAGSMKKAVAALVGILLVGLAFSQIIALSITRPLKQLSDAVGNLSQQNWDVPLPAEGSDEISKLGSTFNQMAQTLRQREASLSRGNRDLFILHTTGLDLMESLDRDELLGKIAARVEDLVRADTTAVSIVDRSDKALKYLGVVGNKSDILQGLEMPVEAGGIYNWMASYGTSLLISDAQTDMRLDGDQMRHLGIKSVMTVPLWSSNTMIGLLTTINKKGSASFDKHDLRLLTVFANLASAALQNASLYNDLKNHMNELKTAQEQLVQSAKMAAIGELSANVAHEINNPLTSVLGYTTHLLKTLDVPEPSRKILGMMEQETLRVRKIIRNLLDFARQRPTWMQPGDLALPLRETVALVQGLATKSAITIEESYPAEPTIVTMDHNEIKQVFLNIVHNALHAMPRGGVLTIRLQNAAENDILVEFADTGIGIAPEHRDRIFEPFFSTKNNGDGTGLGLSISYRIIQNHGGRIDVDSAIGRGTTFTVRLPRLHDTAAAPGGRAGEMRNT